MHGGEYPCPLEFSGMRTRRTVQAVMEVQRWLEASTARASHAPTRDVRAVARDHLVHAGGVHTLWGPSDRYPPLPHLRRSSQAGRVRHQDTAPQTSRAGTSTRHARDGQERSPRTREPTSRKPTGPLLRRLSAVPSKTFDLLGSVDGGGDTGAHAVEGFVTLYRELLADQRLAPRPVACPSGRRSTPRKRVTWQPACGIRGGRPQGVDSCSEGPAGLLPSASTRTAACGLSGPP